MVLEIDVSCEMRQVVWEANLNTSDSRDYDEFSHLLL